MGRTASGVAIVVRPAPAYNEADPASTAAPDFPSEPATKRTCPNVPLCESTARISGSDANSSGPAQRRLPMPTSSASANGAPINRTVNSPQQEASGEMSWPTFGARNVTVLCARRTGPWAASPSEGRPEGVSTATMNAGMGDVAFREKWFKSSMALAMTPRLQRCPPRKFPAKVFPKLIRLSLL